MATIEPYAAPSVFDPPGFAQAIKVTNAQTILFISGQVAWTDQGGPAHSGHFKAQARAVLLALKAQVEAGGGTMANLVKITTFLTDARHQSEYRAVREEVLGKEDACIHGIGRPGIMAPRLSYRSRGDRCAVAKVIYGAICRGLPDRSTTEPD